MQLHLLVLVFDNPVLVIAKAGMQAAIFRPGPWTLRFQKDQQGNHHHGKHRCGHQEAPQIRPDKSVLPLPR